MPSKSIKKKIVRFTILTTLVTTILVSIGLGLFLRRQSRENQDLYLQEKTENIADQIALSLDESRRLTDGLAGSLVLQDWLSSGSSETGPITDWLSSINLEQRYSAVYILNSKGVALASTDQSFVNQDYSFRQYVRDALAGKSGFETAVGVTSHQFGYYFSAPVFNKNNQVVGVLVFKLAPSHLYNIILKRVDNTAEKVMLCDENGVIIYSNFKERILQSLGPIFGERARRIAEDKTYAGLDIRSIQYPQIQALIEGKSRVTEIVTFFDEEEGENEVLALVPVIDFSLYVVVEAKINNFLVIAATIGNIGALFILAIVLIISVLFLIEKFLKPLDALKTMTDNISHGNFSQNNPVTTEDELGSLGMALEEMGSRLKNYYSDLEKGVKLKTQELLEKNKSIEGAKRAITNILEDVAVEKDKSANSAKDLEKFKLALDNASDSIVIMDSHGKIIYVNGSTRTVTGYQPSDIIGTKAGQIWGKSMGEKYFSDLGVDIVKTGKPFSGAMTGHRKQGENFDALIVISPVISHDKQVDFFVCIERDITKEKQIDRAKTEFVSLASHQLRTPLSSINWYTEMLISGDAGKLTQSQKEFAGEIYKGSQRMIDLVNSLLNVSRLELGTFIVSPEPTSIASVCESVLDELMVAVKQKELKIIKDFDAKLPLINVDPRLTRIIMQNLLSNAAKYTPAKGAITVGLKSDKKNVVISVSDTGYGIPQNQQGKIFTKLFRADNVRAKETEGTGLGLYMIKSILEASGGAITFKSKEDKGTEFIVTIPLAGMKAKQGEKTLT